MGHFNQHFCQVMSGDVKLNINLLYLNAARKCGKLYASHFALSQFMSNFVKGQVTLSQIMSHYMNRVAGIAWTRSGIVRLCHGWVARPGRNEAVIAHCHLETGKRLVAIHAWLSLVVLGSLWFLAVVHDPQTSVVILLCDL